MKVSLLKVALRAGRRDDVNDTFPCTWNKQTFHSQSPAPREIICASTIL